MKAKLLAKEGRALGATPTLVDVTWGVVFFFKKDFRAGLVRRNLCACVMKEKIYSGLRARLPKP